MENAGAFFIEMTVEEVVRILIKLGGKRATVAVPVLIEIDRGVPSHFIGKFVWPQIMFAEERFKIGSETLVQPGVRPILAGHQIPEPLVRQLMVDQGIA